MATPMRLFGFCPKFRRNSWKFLQIHRKVLCPCRSLANFSSKSTANVFWELMSSVCVERVPIVGQPLTSFEKQFSNHLQQLELERSLKSDHELRHDEDLKRAERFKKGDTDEVDLDKAAIQTAQDFEDLCQDEFDKFQPASRITEADMNQDLHSLNRALDRYLYLVVNQKLGNEYRWVFPKSVRKDGETLRQTAERVLLTMCGDNLKVQFMGNTPVGFYKFKYPKKMQGEDKPVGAKVFFFHAYYKEGLVIPQKNLINDHHWLTRKELKKYLQPKYFKAVDGFLVDEIDEDEIIKDTEPQNIIKSADDEKVKASAVM